MKNFEPIDGVKILSNCPICNSRYRADEIRVIEEMGNGHMLHMQCKKCKSCLVAIIFSNNMGINSVTLITDLNSQDVIKFKDKEPISIDDVIDMHLLLSKKVILKL